MTSHEQRRANRILWFDGLGGLVAGALCLAASSWLAEIYRVDVDLLRFVAAANLLYGCYSTTLAARMAKGTPPPRIALHVLIAANMTWGLVCAAVLVLVASTASPLIWLHIGGEGLYVFGLGLVERRLVLPFAMVPKADPR